MRRLTRLAMLLLLGACSAPPLEPDGPRVGEMVTNLPPDQPAAPATEPIHTPAAVGAYRRVEQTLPDSADNRAIERRIADLNQQLGTQQNGERSTESLNEAIARYQTLLETPGAPHRDDVLYELAQTYDLLGDTPSSKRYLNQLLEEFPDSDYGVEAHFRRAELAFSAEQYDAAIADYGFVVEHGAETSYWLNARYMLGWTYLKQSRYAKSLDQFLACIDALLAPGTELDTGSREMLDDAMRGMVLDVGYLNGATALADHLEAIHKPAWQYRAYQRLAADWHDQQRYLDSVKALQTFVERNPYDERAPEFSKQAIETLSEADFPAEARKYKEAFITRYRFDGDYWVVNGADVRARVEPTFKTYLLEIAKLAHHDAQQQHDKASFVAAAAFYDQYASTFPNDREAGEARFLQGEALTDAGEIRPAVGAYQQVVHDYLSSPRASEAGYAAILGFQNLLQHAPPDQTDQLKRAEINAQIEYAKLFPSAPHASAAQADAANALFALNEYDTAAELAQDLLSHGDAVEGPARRVAALILAQIAFDDQQFEAAESHYREVLTLSGQADATADVRARLQASIYKQAESAEARGEIDLAVRNYLRVADEDRTSELAVKGQFDAVAAYESAERWSEAADQLAIFRTRYPNDGLAANSSLRLADLYEKAGRAREAADTLSIVASEQADSEAGRQALYHAGELYRDTEPGRAIDSFLAYERTYPAPQDAALEAAQQLDELYQHSGDVAARNLWLQKKIDIANQMQPRMTDRARYLAAGAQLELAQQSRAAFDAIGISHDPAQNLPAKRAALKATVTQFEQAASYGVDEYASASTYQIADIYAALARELLNSARPAGLSDLEREQYDILLEEQASPFEEQAIAIHEINARRIAQGVYDVWVVRSLDALRQLEPARYDRPEVEVGFVQTIR